MKVSLKWLNKYVDISDLDPNDIAQKLTFAGIEVEEIIRLGQGTNLCVGEVMACESHPDSTHLHITQVNLGPKYGIEQIVCGAPNVRVGLKVIVARVGAVLPQMTIVKSTIRGVESRGMLCSLAELGVDHKYLTEAQINGIEELDDSAIIGEENVLGFLGLVDTILDLKLLANRSDCLAVVNVARELGALYERPVNLPTSKPDVTKAGDLVVASQTSLCPQIAIKVIKGIKVGPSPKWLQERLMASGIRSINSIVDIGNYVMLLLGQPLHMYDLEKMPKNELIVRDDMEEDWLALDEKTYHIQKGDIVITSNQQIMCLGGVMGSLTCAVDEQTRDIAIEAAYFDAKTIRHTSTRLNLISESSMRFVKGINKDQAEHVLNLTAMLISDICGAKEELAIVEFDTLNHDDVVIEASAQRINNRLGTNFTQEEIIAALKRVGITIDKKDADGFLAVVPPHRIDITLEADLSEEVIRLCGFENVKSTLPELETTLGAMNERQRHKRDIRDFLVNRGLCETLNYSLVDDKLCSLFASFNAGEHYTLLHPMSEDHRIVRSCLLPSLLATLQYNVARQVKDIAIFELSDVYTQGNTSAHLAIILSGDKKMRGLLQKESYSFYHIKGLLESLMHLLGLDNTRYRIEPLGDDIKELHPGRSAQVMIGKERIAILGELHPYLLKNFDLGKLSTVVMELKLDTLLTLRTSQIKMHAPSKFQAVERDLALIAKKDISAQTIIKLCKQSGHNKISDVELFDVYEGEHIDEGYKSLAIKITYSDDSKAFTSEEISIIEQEIIQALSTKLGVILRS